MDRHCFVTCGSSESTPVWVPRFRFRNPNLEVPGSGSSGPQSRQGPLHQLQVPGSGSTLHLRFAGSRFWFRTPKFSSLAALAGRLRVQFMFARQAANRRAGRVIGASHSSFDGGCRGITCSPRWAPRAARGHLDRRRRGAITLVVARRRGGNATRIEPLSAHVSRRPLRRRDGMALHRAPLWVIGNGGRARSAQEWGWGACWLEYRVWSEVL